MQEFLTRYRGWIIFLVALPISFHYQRYLNIRTWIYRKIFATNKLHDRKVSEICTMVAEGAQTGKLLCTARKPWMTMSIRSATFKDDCVQIPINLKNILHLDKENELLRLEPMVTMGDITHFLVPKGYALAVQVEMDDLTVGGLCMGIGIETSSHRFGFLFETIHAFEVITADGKLVRASRTENKDLFRALPYSHGTLGFLVAVELKIVKVKPYMRLEYLPFHSIPEMSAKFKELSESNEPPSFLEALAFSKDSGVIMCGEFASKPSRKGEKINPINRWYKPWFYTHVEGFLESGRGVEYIPLRHYFHRHTPSIFFQLRDLIPFANQAWYRWLFAWLGAPKVSLMKLTTTKKLRKKSFENRATQDLILPMDKLAEAIDFVHPRYEIYPLWICPVKLYHHGEMEGFIKNPENPLPRKNFEMYVDLGIYGIPPAVKEKRGWDAIKIGREVEEYVRSIHGFHMLYADIFMTKVEFEEMFSHRHYRNMRRKFKADSSLPEVYDKVQPEKWLLKSMNLKSSVSKEEELV